MGKVHRKKNSLTYEFCKEECKKYKLYTEIRDNDLSLYNKIKYNKWIENFNWLTNNIKKYDITSKIHCVYAYIFENEKHVYVGRTIHMKQRHFSHLHPKTSKKDSVYEYMEKINNFSVEPKILEDNLNLNESKIKEYEYCQYFLNNGYVLLNKAKTGLKSSSIGGLFRKWSYEKCLEESKKYSSRGDFRNGNFQAYKAALNKKWLDDFIWLKKKYHEKRTYEDCLNVALKYCDVNTFRKENPTVYVRSQELKCLDSFTWLYEKKVKRGFWLKYENCLQVAEKCKTIHDFQKKYSRAYQVSRINGWLNNFKWLYA